MDFQPIDLTTVSYRKRELVMYPVQKQEFDILASGYSSIHLALFGIFFGTALTSFVTFESVPLGEPTATRFWLAAITFGALSLYCGVMAIKDYRNCRTVLKTIKSETIDVVVTAKS
jgi:hypothetical protein